MSIYRPVFYLKHDGSKTGFCLRFQVEPTQLGPMESASLCVRTPATMPIGFIKPTQQSPPMRVNPRFDTLSLHTYVLNETTKSDLSAVQQYPGQAKGNYKKPSSG
jgi:hypothetical protein